MSGPEFNMAHGREILAIVHDIRKSVGIADGVLRLLTLPSAPPLDAAVRAHIERAQEAMGVTTALARTILDHGGTDKAVLDRSLAAEDVRKACALFTAAHSASLSVTVPAECEKTVVSMGPVALTRILFNVLTNSVDAGQDPSIHVRLWATQLPTRGQSRQADRLSPFLMLTVTDTGPGFGETSGAERVSGVMDHSQSCGTGYGLEIVTTLARRAGGYVFLGESDDGGARVDIGLPVIATLSAP